jgi:hypothetical protein
LLHLLTTENGAIPDEIIVMSSVCGLPIGNKVIRMRRAGLREISLTSIIAGREISHIKECRMLVVLCGDDNASLLTAAALC